MEEPRPRVILPFILLLGGLILGGIQSFTREHSAFYRIPINGRNSPCVHAPLPIGPVNPGHISRHPQHTQEKGVKGDLVFCQR